MARQLRSAKVKSNKHPTATRSVSPLIGANMGPYATTSITAKDTAYTPGITAAKMRAMPVSTIKTTPYTPGITAKTTPYDPSSFVGARMDNDDAAYNSIVKEHQRIQLGAKSGVSNPQISAQGVAQEIDAAELELANPEGPSIKNSMTGGSATSRLRADINPSTGEIIRKYKVKDFKAVEAYPTQDLTKVKKITPKRKSK